MNHSHQQKKHPIQSTTGEKNHSMSLTGVSLKKSSEIKTDLVENRINKTYVRGIKKDLKVLKGLQKHVEMFETHLKRELVPKMTQS